MEILGLLGLLVAYLLIGALTARVGEALFYRKKDDRDEFEQFFGSIAVTVLWPLQLVGFVVVGILWGLAWLAGSKQTRGR